MWVSFDLYEDEYLLFVQHESFCAKMWIRLTFMRCDWRNHKTQSALKFINRIQVTELCDRDRLLKNMDTENAH